ncbi:hypothetical protein F5Y03DRAFT_408253 [Xylaria venustula]|nr:hypothetical protein F5Y03DRAFT_408253 [Xylaria venustula]
MSVSAKTNDFRVAEYHSFGCFPSRPLSPPSATFETDRAPVHFSPSLRCVRLDRSVAPSDDDFRERFHVPLAAYKDRSSKDAINSLWRTYLDSNNFGTVFAPLRGTERDRYRAIIEEEKAREDEKHRLAVDILGRIEEYDQSCLGPVITEKEVEQGYNLLQDYLKQAPRHSEHLRALPVLRYRTRFGELTANLELPRDHWYAGHRPGDPIVRIDPDPIRGYPFQDGDMFYVHELAIPEEGEEPGTHRTFVEGVVPFAPWELYQRFTRYAFPGFVQMTIAAAGFDPRDQGHGAHARWAREVDYLRTLEFSSITDDDRAHNLQLLLRIWKVKYGDDISHYPQFLKDQISISMSSFREMGWLVTKLKSGLPCISRHPYWNHCKELLQTFSGRRVASLAREHVDVTLANEATERLEDGDADNMLIYCQPEEGWVKIQDIYNARGPTIGISVSEIKRPYDAATRIIASRVSSKAFYLRRLLESIANQEPTNLVPTPSDHQSSPDSRKRSRSSQGENHTSSSSSSSSPSPSPSRNKRARSHG